VTRRSFENAITGVMAAPNIALSDAQIAKRLSKWKAPSSPYSSGVLAKYARLVTDASHGAVTG
jgi:dihydroxy-acid dehydratase